MPVKKVVIGSNDSSSKIQNRALVLRMICTKPNSSRIDISRQTGLSKMSITNIVNELIQDGFIDVLGENKENLASGRRPIFLTPRTNSFFAIGIYISRDFVIATLSNLKCEILQELKCNFSFEETESSLLDKIKGLVRSIIDSTFMQGKSLLGIGVACIGPLDIKNGVILSPPNFYNLKSIPIKQILEKEFGYSVYVNNDINASAIAEKLYGKAKDVRNFICLGVANGVGAGIIADDVLFTGDMGFGGEIGHTTINLDGPKCTCGNNGCLELYATIPEIVNQARNSVSLGMDSRLKTMKSITWQDIIHCALKEDNLALNLLDRLCLYISIGLVSLSNILDPQVIYIGYDLALAGSLVSQRLESILNQKILCNKYKKIPVEISAFIDRSPIFGSSAIVMDRLFSNYIEL